jgi:hypothetical protein
MTVYVDNAAIERRGKVWSHLTADSLDELHRFAASIGLKRCWFDGAMRHPHYDVTAPQRARALREGAVAVDRRALLIAAKRLRRRGALTFTDAQRNIDTQEAR